MHLLSGLVVSVEVAVSVAIAELSPSLSHLSSTVNGVVEGEDHDVVSVRHGIMAGDVEGPGLVVPIYSLHDVDHILPSGEGALVVGHGSCDDLSWDCIEGGDAEDDREDDEEGVLHL